MNEKKHSIEPDIWGVVLVAFGLLIFLALISYDSADLALQIHGERDITNWIGPGGAFLSGGLYWLLGIQAIVLPLAIFYLAISCFWRHKFVPSKTTIVGFSILVLAASFFLTQLSRFLPPISITLGGVLGLTLSGLLKTQLSQTGALIVAVASSVVGLILVFSAPLLHMAQKLVSLFRKKAKNIQEKPAAVKFSTAVEELKEVSASALTIFEPIASPSLKSMAQDKPIETTQKRAYEMPPLKLLDYDAPPPIAINEGALRTQAAKLEQTFLQFGIEGKVREIRPGPVVTLFEFVPAPGIKLSRIAALADDIAMAMTAMHVRIVAPIPGKGAVGIELPNERRQTVFLKEIVADVDYRQQSHHLCMAIGKTVEGYPYFVNLADMPHVLIAGTTGSGKSVSVNGMICSILYRATPDEVKFLMIDPKMLELSIYEGIPHLLLPPIIDSKKAAAALRWAVREMDERYLKMNELGVRDIEGYNKKDMPRMPYIVVVVDEYADLIAMAGKDVEGYIMRLAQKARACGIHVMLATQRPSVDIITGVIKANFPVRMSFRLASAHDSKTIINRAGAEKLLGKGDMLVMPPGTSDVMRVHGAYISEKEIMRVVDFWKQQATPQYDLSITETEESDSASLSATGSQGFDDDRYQEAIDIVLRTKKCSTSWLQRQLGVGYNRSARMVEQMELEGIVGPILNAKGDREIFSQGEQYDG